MIDTLVIELGEKVDRNRRWHHVLSHEMNRVFNADREHWDKVFSRYTYTSVISEIGKYGFWLVDNSTRGDIRVLIFQRDLGEPTETGQGLNQHG